MTSHKVRLVVLGAACLTLAAAVATASGSPTTQTFGTNSTDDGNQGAEVLISNSGYMVAVG